MTKNNSPKTADDTHNIATNKTKAEHATKEQSKSSLLPKSNAKIQFMKNMTLAIY